jgi:hypothetical protein
VEGRCGVGEGEGVVRGKEGCLDVIVMGTCR